MSVLCEIAARYRCDKAPSVMHNYTPFYHQTFNTLRYNKIKIFEIGVGTVETMVNVPGYVVGASLFMWQDYFPEAQIYAIDIEPKVMLTGKPNTQRISTYVCDQADSGALSSLMDRLGGEFDFIVDDGSHLADHQIISAIALIPYVKSGGKYIIEDVKDGTEHRIMTALKQFGHESTCLAWDAKQIDDRVIVVQA